MKDSIGRKVAVIGLGYVGLPLCRLFLKHNFEVYGIDIDDRKVQALLRRESYLSDLSSDEIESMFADNRFHVSQSFEPIPDADHVLICVPTPLDQNKQPDLSFVKNAVQTLVPYLRPNHLIVLESSTYPGTTEEVLLPLLSSTGLKVGEDFYLAYSPERINPGEKMALEHIPKVVGGVTSSCTERAKALYGLVFKQVVTVSSPKVAEMAKLLENSQRFINVSFINELAMTSEKMDVDLWEAIAAASTKPYGFMPYYPGPGAGGHCIPVDPIYLLWKSKMAGGNAEFIELAGKINDRMPHYVTERIIKCLPDSKDVSECHVLIVGVAYKKNVNDVRESPVLTVMNNLLEKGAHVSFHDPFISKLQLSKGEFHSVPLSPEFVQKQDCVAILTDHDGINYELLVQQAQKIFDARHAISASTSANKENIIYL